MIPAVERTGRFDEPTGGGRRFVFERDTFAFANELVWQYRFDAATGGLTTFRTDPPPAYYHRCFVMVRAARQFLERARFDPSQPAADVEGYRAMIRQVISRGGGEGGRVVIPGYDGLRAFSQAQPALLKAECGGPWEGYFLRTHWRMVFPVWGWQQAKVAGQLKGALESRSAVIVHLFRFPNITINHGILLYGRRDCEVGTEFEAYDPNIPGRPVRLLYDASLRCFVYPQAHYWAGGAVSVIQIFRGGRS